MVILRSATSLTLSGLRDWIIQRASSVIIGIYTLVVLGFILFSSNLTYQTWHNLFSHPVMRIFSFLVLLSIVLHSWVGIWTVFTDYIKPFAIRFVLTILLVLLLFAYLAWGIEILWGL